MCILVISWQQHEAWPLVLAGNRDEFHERPTQALHRWADAPIVGGQDLQEGGAWFAVGTDGRFAALTNVRDGQAAPENAPSRGELIPSYLQSAMSAQQYAEFIQPQLPSYAGCNLFVGDADQLWYLSNRQPAQCLQPGLYGLSNATLDTPWPKVQRLKALAAPAMASDAALLQILKDEHRPESADELPKSSWGEELDRLLAAIFIRNEHYGTRANTVLRRSAEGHISMTEQLYDPISQQFSEPTCIQFQTEPTL